MDAYKKLKYRYFILSFAASFFVLMCLFLGLVNLVHPRVPKALAQTDISEPPWIPDAKDALTVLFMGTSGGDVPPSSYVLARLDPLRGNVPITIFPPETAVNNLGKTETLTEVYRYGGSKYVRDTLSQTLNISIDRYVRMSESSFIQCADAIGSVELFLPSAVDIKQNGVEIRFQDGIQLLDGTKAANLIRWDVSQTDTNARHRLTGNIAAAIVNQRGDIVLSTVADRVFERLINLIDTDISYADYVNYKAGAKYLMEQKKNPATPVPVSGVYSGGEFVLSDTFLALFAQIFG